MKVLDLFLNFRFNSRMAEFVGLFKALYHSATMPMRESSPVSLVELLKDEFDVSENKKLVDFFSLVDMLYPYLLFFLSVARLW